MTIQRALRTSRLDRGLKQSELGIPVTQQAISKMERGTVRVAQDLAPMLAKKLDHPATYLELSRELTGGYGPAWLDGPNVDLHRASVRERCIAELKEAMEYIERFPASRLPQAETDRDKKARYDHLMQCFDAVVALNVYMGVQCLEYGYSMLQLSKDHYQKLKGRRYVQS